MTMSYSYTLSGTETFNVSHARKLAAKVATDLKRMQRFYGRPSDIEIADYEAEVVELLVGGYLDAVTYGFKRADNWIEPTLQYTARELAGLASSDDDPGRVRAGANVTGAHFYSYLTYTDAWWKLTPTEKESIKRRVPIQRHDASQPGIDGYLDRDRTYSAGGRALERATVRSYG
jgi:hypothetical protein